MKTLTISLFAFLVAINLTAQDTNYEILWKKVEQLELDGKPKSALEIVNTITDKAKKEKDDPQLIKTLLFKSKFSLILEENSQLQIISNFKSEIANSTTPKKNILESMLGKLYWDYYQQNRYKFYNRTKTKSKVDTTDFRTWDLETLFSEIKKQYEKSLQNGLILQLTPSSDYETIIALKNTNNTYTPTLFDLLSQQALQFYTTPETQVTQPIDAFEITDTLLLGSVDKFINYKWTFTKDPNSLQLSALKTYQDVLRFHNKKGSEWALATKNIERLQFVKKQARFNNKRNKYISTIQNEEKNTSTPYSKALYQYEIASQYLEMGNTYSPKNPEHQWKKKEALEILEVLIKKFPDTFIAQNSSVLKNNIRNPSLEIQAEKHLPTNSKSRMLITYKNQDSLFFKAYKISHKKLVKFNEIYQDKERKDFIKKLDLLTTWNPLLTNKKDYQEHTTEIIVPGFPEGNYLIVAAPNNTEEAPYQYTHIQYTNIALIKKEDESRAIFQVIDRNNGKPLQNATAIATFNRRRNSTRTKTYTTNTHGEFFIPKRKGNTSSIDFKIEGTNNTAYFDNYYSGYYYDKDDSDENQYKSFTFTDRSIYRPGQTVHFKTIVLKKEGNRWEVFPNHEVYIDLYDANDDDVAELELTTNEYGSVSGQFSIPTTGLTGSHYLTIYSDDIEDEEEHSFLVEEYKRPKFEATFQPIIPTYRLNDSIVTNGDAHAFSGSAISNAQVTYTVTRSRQLPYRRYWSRNYDTSTGQQEIAFGETTTDNKGNFKIIFKAAPDTKLDPKTLPIFKYEIKADVTDINGETQSTSTIVQVGYHTLLADVSIAPELDKDDKKHTFSITTKNLNNESVPAEGTVKIYKLKAPGQPKRERPWNAPDEQNISQEEFEKLFPHDTYTDSSNPSEWEVGTLYFSEKFDTKKEKEIRLGILKKWPSGYYKLILKSQDKFGQAIEEIRYTSLFSKNDSQIADQTLFSISKNKISYDLGETVQLKMASATALHVTVSIEKEQKIIQTYVVQLNNNIKYLSIPVTEKDTRGFAIHYSYAAFNNHKNGTIGVLITQPSRELKIETQTFRDKLQPGAEETWSFQLKGPTGEKVAAELLASMYDASLDTFKEHQWQFDPVPSLSYASYYRTQINNSFDNVYFNQGRNRYYNHSNIQKREYDHFNWFGLYIQPNSWQYNTYLNTLRQKVHSKYSPTVQKGYVSGYVFDDFGEPLPGANIIVKGTARGAQTDLNGFFTIKATKDEKLVISYIGFNNAEIKIKKNNLLSINLAEDTDTFDEVIIAAEGSVTEKKALSYSVTEVSAEEITSTPSTNKAESGSISSLLNSLPGVSINQETAKIFNLNNVKIRKNLQETAFFFPHLTTDAKGNINFSFTTPEALTEWKLQLLAHTKDLQSKVTTLKTVTQKELSVVPNAPRFLREGDTIYISSKIANISKKDQIGQVVLQLQDAISGNNIDSLTQNTNALQNFTIPAQENTQLTWQLIIPETVQAVQYQVIAKTEKFSDGEQNVLPVLSNRMLVTETLPMWVRSNESRTFTLDKLKNNTSTTLKNHRLTLEVTSNPAWYAIQALPYLMEYPYECNEQTFSKYYSNTLASHIVNSNPSIKTVFEQWKNSDALLSNLEKNQELKSLLIQETPWLRNATSEAEQKKRIALLFDLNLMTQQQTKALNKLKQNQLGDGSWAWFNGGYGSRYITQHIAIGFGHLEQLGVENPDINANRMVVKAIKYLDQQFIKEYKDLKKYNSDIDYSSDHLSHTQLHYLYMRSFYPQIKKSAELQKIQNYYLDQINTYWNGRSLYAKGLMALVAHRNNKASIAKKIVTSLNETSITSDELGMYWKANTSSWHWYQAPIETQALMIEVFSEISSDATLVDNLKIWLLKNKQTNRWKTTKATTDAVYALLLQGSDWLSISEAVAVQIGTETIDPNRLDGTAPEAGTGYFKTNWNTTEITPEKATVTFTKKGNGIAWGGLYWQYFEDLDKITSAKTPLQIKKKLFLKENTTTGEEISEITSTTSLKVGNLIRVRVELKVDRDMSYVHMKDMRASGLESINVLSQYKYQDGLGYYEATKDAATHFFFEYLPKGVYVFEYDLRVNNAGNFSNGITTVQCMYAPEFSSHSEGVRVRIEK